MRDDIRFVLIKKNVIKKVLTFSIHNFPNYEYALGKKKVGKINLINNDLVEKIILKKIAKKFSSLLEIIASACEDDEDPASGFMISLNEIERFKREIINKYVAYLSDKKIKFLDKKIKIIEQEVQCRIYAYNEKLYDVKENERSSHHSR